VVESDRRVECSGGVIERTGESAASRSCRTFPPGHGAQYKRRMAEYLALPKADGRYPAVVVIQEYWGVTDQIKGVCDKWVGEGFIAIAPDLYDGKIATTAEEAGAMMKALDRGKTLETIAAAIEKVRTHPSGSGKVAVTGYCLGGAFALAAAASVRGLSAIVPFYGMPPGGDWASVEAPILMHVAMHDNWVTVDGAKKLQATLAEHGKQLQLHIYDAQHAFCNERRPEVYDASACREAWHRTVTFVKQHTSA
jgi:carboxymethylenebutenolidase